MARARRAANGDGSIYQRDDKRWVGSFVADGKRKYIYGKSQKEAREKLRKAQQDHQQGTLVDASRQKVKDYLEYWIGVHGPSIKATTGVMYTCQLRAHVIPALGHILLQKLTTDRIQALYAELAADLKSSSIRTLHIILNAALGDAVEWGKLSKNPCSKIKLPREVKHEMMPLTQEQAQKLLQVAQHHKLSCLLTLALATGMREGELLALHWNDIDFERKQIRVQHTLTYTPKRGHQEDEPKTAGSRRSIVLAQHALEALKQHRKNQLKTRLPGAAWEEKGLVFCNLRGGYLWVSHVRREFKALLQAAGLPDIRFHDLRHSCATALLMKGVHPKIVQEILGHSSIRITMDIYSHVLPSMQQDAMSHMDTFLAGENAMKEVM